MLAQWPNVSCAPSVPHLQRSSVLGNKIEMEITELVEKNSSLLRLGLHLEFNDARHRIANHLQRNIDRSKYRALSPASHTAFCECGAKPFSPTLVRTIYLTLFRWNLIFFPHQMLVFNQFALILSEGGHYKYANHSYNYCVHLHISIYHIISCLELSIVYVISLLLLQSIWNQKTGITCGTISVVREMTFFCYYTWIISWTYLPLVAKLNGFFWG